jgi:hypothetical protein
MFIDSKIPVYLFSRFIGGRENIALLTELGLMSDHVFYKHFTATGLKTLNDQRQNLAGLAGQHFITRI